MPQFVDTYEEAVAYLFDRINYENALAGSYSTRDFKLDRMRQLLSLLGDPHQRVPAVHVAGTKGKGSTAVMVAEILSAADCRTGLFTSPHVSAFEERMTVDGVSPSRQQVVDLVNRVAAAAERLDRSAGPMRPTFFEITTAMAWLYFSDGNVERAVLEVGLGGRLDSTNLCRSDVCIITNVGHDHTEQLGNTLSKIAAEKAGIVKPGIPVLSGVGLAAPRAVVADVCRANGAPLVELGRDIRFVRSDAADGAAQSVIAEDSSETLLDVETPGRTWTRVPVRLCGSHQHANAALAVAAVNVLRRQGERIPIDAVRRGMSAVHAPLRIEVLRRRPTVIVDAAHNPDSAGALTTTLDAHFRARRRILIFAATRDKDVAGLVRLLLPKFDTVILSQYTSNPRGLPVEQLERVVQSAGAVGYYVAADAASAWKLAAQLAEEEDLVCATGSFYFAAEMRMLLADDFTQREQSEPAAAV
jgi:dihydrofolate synthase/folylpolyglutamate synthase